MSITNSENQFKKKSFVKIALMICIPMLVISVALFSIVIINFTTSKKTHEQYVSFELYNIGRSGEKKITNVVDIMRIIPGNDVLAESVFSSASVFDEITTKELNTLKKAYDFIDDIHILNQETKKICNTNGIYSMEDFYTNIYSYSNYDMSYWKNFRFYDTNDYKILSPTIVKAPGDSKEIMPVVIRRIDDRLVQNYIIVNISLEYLIEHNKQDTTVDFQVYLLNKFTSEIFSSDGVLLNSDSFPDDFYSNLLLGKINSFEYKLKTGKYLVATYSPVNNMTGYTYFALIPIKTILGKLFPNILILIGIIIVFLSAACLIAIYNSTRIFNPLYKITSSVSNKQKRNTSGNIFDAVTHSFSEIQEENKQLSATLPYAQEKYLINYLNTTEYYMDDEAQNIIKNTLKFPHNYFAVVIVQITPTNQMFDIYNSTDYQNIKSGLYSIIKMLFSQKYSYFLLPGDNDSLYIVLNMEKKEDILYVNDILKNIYDMLQNDMEYINISIGKSNVYENLSGLKQAHKEALDSLSLHVYTSDQILLDNSENEAFEFSHKDESDLFAAFASYNSYEAYTILNNILGKNTNASPRSQKHLLSNIASIILKAIRVKGIPYKDNKLEFEILNELLKQPPNEIKRDIMTLTDYYFSNDDLQQYQAKVNANDCINYIRNNFTFSELSLDFLANYFHTTPSNISTIVKASLGMGYHEFLTSLRIDEAKDMLINTNKTAGEIFQSCGFSSQQTFYRTFKKTVGITPTEFRNRNRNKDNKK